MSISFTQLCKELELLQGIFNHFLLDAAENHSVQRLQVRVIVLCSLLEDNICTLVITHQNLLLADLSMVVRILWLQHNSEIKYLQSVFKTRLFASTVASTQP